MLRELTMLEMLERPTRMAGVAFLAVFECLFECIRTC